MAPSGMRLLAARACSCLSLVLFWAMTAVCGGESHGNRERAMKTVGAVRDLLQFTTSAALPPEVMGVSCPLEFNSTELDLMISLFPKPPAGLPPPPGGVTIPSPCTTYTLYTMSKNLRNSGQFFLPADTANVCIRKLYNDFVLPRPSDEQVLCPLTVLDSNLYTITPKRKCHFESTSSLNVNLTAIAEACTAELVFDVEQCSRCGKAVVNEATKFAFPVGDCLMAVQVYYQSRIANYERWLQVASCIGKEGQLSFGLNLSVIYPGAPALPNPFTLLNPPPTTATAPVSQATSQGGGGGKKSSSKPIIVGAAVGAVFLLFAGAVVLLAYRRYVTHAGRRSGGRPNIYHDSPPTNVTQLPKGARSNGELHSQRLRLYSLATLASATNNFSDANRIGKGGSAEVFRGILLGGKVVAIKKMSKGAIQADTNFLNELSVISAISHPNLVALEGYCKCNNGEFLLVYDFMPNGTLEDALFKPGYPFKLSWEQWSFVILDSARGLDYLHSWNNSQGNRIIHRDVKLANILLDGHFHGRLTDFGIARRMNNEQTHVTTKILGTFGYLAPEYASTGWLTEKSDVYSFGVVMLAIITRKQVIGTEKGSRAGLVADAFTAAREERLMEMVSPIYLGEHMRSQLERYLSVSLLCLQTDPVNRPTMSEVIKMLEGRADVPEIYIPIPQSMSLTGLKPSDMASLGSSGGGFDTGSSGKSHPFSMSSSGTDTICGELPPSASIDFDNRSDLVLNSSARTDSLVGSMRNVQGQPLGSADGVGGPGGGEGREEIQAWPITSPLIGAARRASNSNSDSDKIDLR